MHSVATYAIYREQNDYFQFFNMTYVGRKSSGKLPLRKIPYKSRKNRTFAQSRISYGLTRFRSKEFDLWAMQDYAVFRGKFSGKYGKVYVPGRSWCSRCCCSGVAPTGTSPGFQNAENINFMSKLWKKVWSSNIWKTVRFRVRFCERKIN